MAVIPEVKNLTPSAKTSQKILTAIYANASDRFKAEVPEINTKVKATLDISNLRAFGSVIINDKDLQNEFVSALINRIGNVIVSSKLYENPWAFLKRGVLELGEVIEDIFVDLAHPKGYDPKKAEDDVFKRHLPDVKSAFYRMNYQYYYPTTIEQNELKLAFLSWSGVSKMISDAVQALYNGANYDEYICTKYMLVQGIIQGLFYPVTIPAVTKDNMDDIVTTVRATTSKLTFMKKKYNRANVNTYTDFSDGYIFVDSDFEASMDVNVLAANFHMEKADFLSQRVLVDGFGDLDTERLTELFGDKPGFSLPDEETLNALSKIPLIYIDKDAFVIYDNLLEMADIYNQRGMYYNYDLHVWKTFALSPFRNAVMFLPFEQTVDSVTVSPSTATVTAGQAVVFTADVETDGFAKNSVIWSVSGNTSAETEIINGTLYVGLNETGSITVTATSTFDESVNGTAAVTVVGGITEPDDGGDEDGNN